MSNEINQKAKELVEKYMNAEFGLIQEYLPKPSAFAKQCALILCDEMIKEYAVLQIETSFCYKLHLEWVAIKQAIENL
jgi:glutathione synthase/RimK-type ligase-like ATP-grasp enzyme